MLSDDPGTHEAVREAMICWHRRGTLPADAPGMQLLENGNRLSIEYGFGGRPSGRLKFKREQYELVEVTGPNHEFQALTKYNHAGTSRSKQDFLEALRCGDLKPKQHLVSRMIILTSECARSEVVFAVIQRILRGGPSLTDDEWGGLEHAFKTYKKTAEASGFQITAGQAPWTTLRTSDYKSYVQGPSFTGAKDKVLGQIEAVAAYARKLEM